MNSYFNVMLLIEKNLETIDLESLLSQILDVEADTLSIKNRYYLLENRLNAIMGHLAKKMTDLNQEKNTLLKHAALYPKPNESGQM